MSSGSGEGTGYHLAYTGTMLFICTVAVVLNILVIGIIFKSGRFRTSVDIFVTNLAVSDILQAGVVLPIHFSDLTGNTHDFAGDNAACKLVMFIPLFTVTSAIYTIIAIAADRYRVMIYRRMLLLKETLVVVAIVWVLSICVSAPQLYEYSVYSEVNEVINITQTHCGSWGIVENFEVIYASIVFVLSYSVPLLVLVFCYTSIAILVLKHAKRFQSNSSACTNNNIRNSSSGSQLETVITTRKVKVLKMLISITIAFVVLWTPYFILFALQEISDMDHSKDFAKWPHLVSRTMSVLSTVTNPTVYLFFSDAFRRIMQNIVTCSWKQSSDIQTDLETLENQESLFACCTCCFRDKRRVAPNDLHVSARRSS